MAAILVIVGDILSAVLELLGIASVLQSGTNAIENFLGIHTGGVTLQEIYDQAHLANVNTLFTSDVGTISLLDIHNQIAALSAQVAAYSPAATHVDLPPTAPAGYGGASTSDTADAVWRYVWPATDQQTGDMLGVSYVQAALAGNAGAWAGKEGIRFQVETNTALEFTSLPDFGTPAPNWSNITPTDTILSFLTREWGGIWHTDANNGTLFQYANETTKAVIFRCTVDPLEFEYLKSIMNPSSATVAVPPVWPGLAKASLSATHVLSDGLIITEPMDGVILELTSVAPPIQRIHYGTVEAYGHIGALSFGNDNGDQEAFQFISFANQVYCTLHFKRAQSVVIKLRAGISGTATPWTVT